MTRAYVDELSRSQQALSEHAYVLSAILDSIGAGLIVFNKEHKVILANRTMIRLAGRDLTNLHRNEMVKMYSFFKDEGNTRINEEEMPYAKAVKEKTASSMEAFALGESLPAEGVWLNALAAPVFGADGEFLGVVTVLQDVTTQKRLERQRNALATLITHDLKNHLAGWDLLLEATQMDFSQLDENLLKAVAQLKEGNKQYLELTNTLLELYRSDFYVLEACRKEIDVVQTINSAVELNSSYAASAGVAIELKIADNIPTIRGIPSALRQTIHNLIQNAIDVSPRDSSVEIAASGRKERTTISVRDHGPGIPQDHVQSIFDEVHFASSLPKAAHSSGFGLYLSRLLVESHGGKIFCQSEVGSGSVFTIELPISR
jgi:signal transduction histidine kinase